MQGEASLRHVLPIVCGIVNAAASPHWALFLEALQSFHAENGWRGGTFEWDESLFLVQGYGCYLWHLRAREACAPSARVCVWLDGSSPGGADGLDVPGDMRLRKVGMVPQCRCRCPKVSPGPRAPEFCPSSWLRQRFV